MFLPELLMSVAMEELLAGFILRNDFYICILCGHKIEKGIIYNEDGVFYEAEKFMKLHIEKKHRSVFDYLIDLDKKITGLSEHQKKLLSLFYQNKSDAEILSETGIGSESTIRNHRFNFKEKERQSKIFLALMELLKIKENGLSSKAKLKNIKKYESSGMEVLPDEREKILKKYFPEGTDGVLKTFTMKEKSRLVILQEITRRFDKKLLYSEKEVNLILKTIFHDFAAIRRYLIDYGFMERNADGSGYRLKNKTETGNKEEKMDRKKELRRQYDEMKKEGGIYQIKNTVNQKVFLVATPNLKTMNGRFIELQRGGHRNKALQEDFNKYGESSFISEVLESIDQKDEDFDNKLKKAEEKWLEKIKPYGEKGYNTEKPSLKK